LETVTPLFLGGEQQQAELLRPPSFRGAMRYWLRAGLGSIYGDTSDGLKQIRDDEGKIFGIVGDKEISKGSGISVRLRMFPSANINPIGYKKTKSNLPSGIDYLYWSMGKMGEKTARDYYQPNTKFNIILTEHSNVNENNLSKAEASLWLLIHLGGIGARSRRTAGSLRVVNGSSMAGLIYQIPDDKEAIIADHLGTQIKKTIEIFRNNRNDLHEIKFSEFSEFDILHPEVCKILVLKKWNTWEQAVNNIGTAFREFRHKREPDHKDVAKLLSGSKINKVERAVFGLPIPYRYSSGLSGVIRGKIDKNGGIERRASPLWLKIIKINDNSFIGVATLFTSRFLPDGEKIYAKGNNANERLGVEPPADYGLIEDFISGRFANFKEVEYA